MEFLVYNEKIEPKKETYLRLFKLKECVSLMAVDKYGHPYHNSTILSISNDGVLVLQDKVNDKCGFSLDEHGIIKIEKRYFLK